MDTTSLFTAALQLPDPWRVSGVESRDGADCKRELHITIGFASGSRFHCPEAGRGEASCPAHDARERVWRHLNFFQYKAFIHAGVPRVACPEHGVRAVPAPWARPGSGFTLLFEAMVVELAKTQPVADIAEQVGEHDTRLWRFIRHYVDEARRYKDYTGVEAIGIDETSRRGHRYITVVADLVERNVVCVVPGKDSSTVGRFARDFMDHNGDPGRVRLAACDMSLGFAKGIREHLPNAAKAVDKFHVVKHANEAVDKVRKAEARDRPVLRNTKYVWLRNEASLTDPHLEVKRNLAKQRLKTARACGMRECLQDIYAANLTKYSWNTKKDGSGASYGDKAAIRNLASVQDEVIVLYAQWADAMTVLPDTGGQAAGHAPFAAGMAVTVAALALAVLARRRAPRHSL